MNCKLISGSGSQACFHPCSKPFQSTTESMLQLTPTHLSLNTHLAKQRNSIKTSSRSYRTTTKAAVSNIYATNTETKLSLYELLGISECVSQLEIKRAYKQLALKYHPDVSPPDQTEEYTRTFIRVQEAYETLSDERTRALYDMDLSNGLHLAFSARKQRSVETENWMNIWEAQLTDLKRRSANKDSGGKNMSWGDRIRSQRQSSV